MKRRFIVLVDDATRVQQDAVTLFLKGRFGFWHHFSDSWLVTTSDDRWDAPTLRDAVARAVPGPAVLVLLLGSFPRWAAFGPKGMFDWLHTTWRKE